MVCGGEKVASLTSFSYALEQGNPLDPQVELVSCRHCGAVFCLSASQESDYSRYYARNSGYLRQGNLVGLGGKEEQRYYETVRLLNRHSVRHSAHLVDVGCGQGGLVKVLAQEGWEKAYGIDPNQQNIAAMCAAGYKASLGTLPSLPLEDASCDVLMASHVLEHLFDLGGALNEARRVLRPKGLFYVEVPDAHNYPGIPAAPAADFILEHINHFDRDALVNCLGQYGFIPLEVGGKKLLHGCGGDFCLYGLFQMVPEITPATPSFALAEHLRKLCIHHGHHCAAIRKHCLEASSILIWGLSSYMLHIISMLNRHRITISGLFDGAQYKQKWKIGDMFVQNPEKILECKKAKILLLIPAGHYAHGMVAFLREKGFCGTILPV